MARLQQMPHSTRSRRSDSEREGAAALLRAAIPLGRRPRDTASVFDGLDSRGAYRATAAPGTRETCSGDLGVRPRGGGRAAAGRGRARHRAGAAAGTRHRRRARDLGTVPARGQSRHSSASRTTRTPARHPRLRLKRRPSHPWRPPRHPNPRLAPFKPPPPRHRARPPPPPRRRTCRQPRSSPRRPGRGAHRGGSTARRREHRRHAAAERARSATAGPRERGALRPTTRVMDRSFRAQRAGADGALAPRRSALHGRAPPAPQCRRDGHGASRGRGHDRARRPAFADGAAHDAARVLELRAVRRSLGSRRADSRRRDRRAVSLEQRDQGQRPRPRAPGLSRQGDGGRGRRPE